MTQRTSGFTLLELLVALSIMSLVTSMAYGGLNAALKTMQHIESQSNQMQELQAALLLIVRDHQHVSQRPIRDEFGEVRPALHSLIDDVFEVEFTHSVRRHFVGEKVSDLQRVSYGVLDDKLWRRTWVVLDRAFDSASEEHVLLSNVLDFELRYLGSDMKWRQQWLPVDQSNDMESIPSAIEMTVDIQDVGRIRRLVVLSNHSIDSQHTTKAIK